MNSQKWQRYVAELIGAGLSVYYIAKIVCHDDRKKVKRWRDGISIPNANEGPLLEQMHREYVSRETRGIPPSCREQIST